MAKFQYLTTPVKTERMPKGIPYIVVNEAAERFCYYGINGILVVYMTKYLMDRQGRLDTMSDTNAEAWYHIFVSAVYFLPVLGALLADAFLGKYLTILSLSFVYCLGSLMLALDTTRLGLVVGLSLIALGSGGIKPCVSANVGDQFGSANEHLLPRVFSWFYFSINIGSAFSTIFIPEILDRSGPRLAFGLPGILMFFATVIFWLGRRKFVHVPPAVADFLEAEQHQLTPPRPWNVTVLSLLARLGGLAGLALLLWYIVFKVASGGGAVQVGSGLLRELVAFFILSILLLILGFGWRYGQNWARLLFLGSPVWMAGLIILMPAGGVERIVALAGGIPIYAIITYYFTRPATVTFFTRGQPSIDVDSLKAIGNLLILVPFAAMFWALWQQNFSSWVVQAYKMDRYLFGKDWLPAQIQTVNPIFVLVMLPLFSYVIYPTVEKFVRLTPLRKFGAGLFAVILAFLIVGGIQMRIDAGGKPHIIWQILAFVVLTTGEVMVSVTHLEFSYTQAPKKLKSLVMCLYLGSIALGNVFTAAVNFFIQNPDGTTKLTGASYYFFFVWVMLGTAIVYLFVAPFYRGKTYSAPAE